MRASAVGAGLDFVGEREREARVTQEASLNVCDHANPVSANTGHAVCLHVVTVDGCQLVCMYGPAVAVAGRTRTPIAPSPSDSDSASDFEK